MNEIDMAARLAVLEVKVEQWNKQCAEDRAETKHQINGLDGKIDELLGLKNKGMGAFALISALLGTSLIGTITMLSNWIR